MDAYESLLETAGLDDQISILMVICSVIFAPFCEELVFRGVTMHQAKKCLPFWAANLLQALLFGIFHMNMIQGIYAFCLGLVLGYVCNRGGSIYYSSFCTCCLTSGEPCSPDSSRSATRRFL